MKIIPIVEGHGEIEAVPILLRRLLARSGTYAVDVGRPIKATSTELARPESLLKKLYLARLQEDSAGALVLFDADDYCPARKSAELRSRVSTHGFNFPWELALANREYESWFLAAFDSLRGVLPFRADALPPPDPEARRNSKGLLTELLSQGRAYSPTIDQKKLTARFDIEAAYRASRSFRHFVDAFDRLVEVVSDTTQSQNG